MRGHAKFVVEPWCVLRRLLWGMHVEMMADENKVLAGKAGAIDAVVAAMRAHVGNAGVLEQACDAMCRICLNGSASIVCVCALSEVD